MEDAPELAQEDGNADSFRNLTSLDKSKNDSTTPKDSETAGLRAAGGITSGVSSFLNLFQTYKDLSFAYSKDKGERQNKDGSTSKSKIGSMLSRGLVNTTKLGASAASNAKEIIKMTSKNKGAISQSGKAFAGFQVATGAMDVGMGGYESYKAGKRLKGIDAIREKNKSDPGAATDEQLALMKNHQRTMLKRGNFKFVTGALDAAAGASTLGGAIPLAMAFGGLSTALKFGSTLRKKATQYGRQRASQRMRSKTQIAKDAQAKYENFGTSAENHTQKMNALKGVSAAGAGPGILGTMRHWLGAPSRQAQIMYHSRYANKNKKYQTDYAKKVGAQGNNPISEGDYNTYADQKIKKYSSQKMFSTNRIFGTRDSGSIDAATPAALSGKGFGFNTNKTKEKKQADEQKLATFLLDNQEYREQMIGKDSKYYHDLDMHNEDAAKAAKLELIMEKLTGKQLHDRKKFKEENPQN